MRPLSVGAAVEAIVPIAATVAAAGSVDTAGERFAVALPDVGSWVGTVTSAPGRGVACGAEDSTTVGWARVAVGTAVVATVVGCPTWPRHGCHLRCSRLSDGRLPGGAYVAGEVASRGT